MKPFAVGIVVAVTVYMLTKDWKIALIVASVHLLAHKIEIGSL